MLLALTLTALAAPVPKVEPADWKAALKDREFRFDDDRAGADPALDAARRAGLTAEFTPYHPAVGVGEFVFAQKGGPRITVRGHLGSAFVVYGDALYFADYSPISAGCTVLAYDLTTGKRAWAKPLAGLGPVDHSKHWNQVLLAVEPHPTARGAFALVATGAEAAGLYVEARDLVTGGLLANKTFAPDLYLRPRR